MNKSYRIARDLSILIVAFYITLTVLSLLRYPESFSPISNWLSDLGNRITNPSGSKYYNAGIFISGSLLTFFFLSLGSSRIPGLRVQNIMLLLTQVFGIIGSMAMIMTGIFSIDIPQTHSLFSALLRINLGTAFGFSVAALLYHKEVRKWVLLIGVTAALTDLIVSVLFNKTQLLEWPVIALFLIYCIVLGNETYRLGNTRTG